MGFSSESGPIHFVGIGGIGMSGIAEVMNTLGYKVQGSDQNESANVKRLRGLGIDVVVGHAPENIGNAQVIVISSAVKSDNVEVTEARRKLLPVVRRADMLAELMRLKKCVAIGGTHGKTTTTSLVAALLEKASLDPTVINGGIINAYGTNARLGTGEWMVVEADESDGTFIRLPAEIAVVTNIDPEHLDHYGDFDALRAAFKQFIENIPFYGFAVMCTDHGEVQNLLGNIEDRRILTYGLNPQADLRLENLRFENGDSYFDVNLSDRMRGGETRMAGLKLPMPGKHNVLNALAAIIVAHELGVEADVIAKGLASFEGVKRRFTKTGVWDGVAIFDDYGHHPVEIAAVLKAARESTKEKVIAVVQPHRYTRLQSLFEDFCTCFNDADTVLVAPVYAAGEEVIEGAESSDLIKGLAAHGHRHAIGFEGSEDLSDLIKEHASKGDYVVCLGAGSISAWANDLPGQLNKG